MGGSLSLFLALTTQKLVNYRKNIIKNIVIKLNFYYYKLFKFINYLPLILALFTISFNFGQVILSNLDYAFYFDLVNISGEGADNNIHSISSSTQGECSNSNGSNPKFTEGNNTIFIEGQDLNKEESSEKRLIYPFGWGPFEVTNNTFYFPAVLVDNVLGYYNDDGKFVNPSPIQGFFQEHPVWVDKNGNILPGQKIHYNIEPRINQFSLLLFVKNILKIKPMPSSPISLKGRGLEGREKINKSCLQLPNSNNPLKKIVELLKKYIKKIFLLVFIIIVTILCFDLKNLQLILILDNVFGCLYSLFCDLDTLINPNFTELDNFIETVSDELLEATYNLLKSIGPDNTYPDNVPAPDITSEDFPEELRNGPNSNRGSGIVAPHNTPIILSSPLGPELPEDLTPINNYNNTNVETNLEIVVEETKKSSIYILLLPHIISLQYHIHRIPLYMFYLKFIIMFISFLLCILKFIYSSTFALNSAFILDWFNTINIEIFINSLNTSLPSLSNLMGSLSLSPLLEEGQGMVEELTGENLSNDDGLNNTGDILLSNENSNTEEKGGREETDNGPNLPNDNEPKISPAIVILPNIYEETFDEDQEFQDDVLYPVSSEHHNTMLVFHTQRGNSEELIKAITSFENDDDENNVYWDKKTQDAVIANIHHLNEQQRLSAEAHLNQEQQNSNNSNTNS